MPYDETGEPIRCWDCDGEGSWETDVPYGDTWVSFRDECQMCDGRGYVTAGFVYALFLDWMFGGMSLPELEEF